MNRFEYKVIPAPTRGEKSRAAKTTPDRFALALTNLMNEMGRDGWDYIRADTLPVDERAGFTGTKTSFQNMLVFRRSLAAENDEPSAGAGRVEAPASIVPRLGAAEAPVGQAPAVGPANPELADQ